MTCLPALPQDILYPMRQLTADDYADQLQLVCTSDEAAELLGCTPAWVKVLCQQGRLAAKRMPRDWCINRASVLAFKQLPPLKTGPKPAAPPGPKKRRARP